MNKGDMPEFHKYFYCDNEYRLRWKIDKGSAKENEIAGSPSGRGYRQLKLHGKKYLVHRVIFFMENGFMPLMVDHIDRNTSNNRPENLRAVTHSQNMINRKLQENNSSGKTGVDYMKARAVWRAQIHVNGHKIYLGTFKNKSLAIQARKRAEKKYHGDYVPK